MPRLHRHEAWWRNAVDEMVILMGISMEISMGLMEF